MNAYIIVLAESDTSIEAAQRCRLSTKMELTSWDATTANDAEYDLKKAGLEWTYPWQGVTNDLRTGLKLTAYQTANPRARIGCFMSHYTLWKQCILENTPILILEHDAIFIREISDKDMRLIVESPYGIIGINDPRGATRRSGEYHNLTQDWGDVNDLVVQAPKIDDWSIPQGIAGNSAYIIKPAAASKMLQLSHSLGAWPNDALMCYQNFEGRMLGQTKTYFTQVQGTRSTTTL
mgnify:FL=1